MSPQSSTSADRDDKQVKMRARMSMGVPECVCVRETEKQTQLMTRNASLWIIMKVFVLDMNYFVL